MKNLSDYILESIGINEGLKINKDSKIDNKMQVVNDMMLLITGCTNQDDATDNDITLYDEIKEKIIRPFLGNYYNWDPKRFKVYICDNKINKEDEVWGAINNISSDIDIERVGLNEFKTITDASVKKQKAIGNKYNFYDSLLARDYNWSITRCGSALRLNNPHSWNTLITEKNT